MNATGKAAVLIPCNRLAETETQDHNVILNFNRKMNIQLITLEVLHKTVTSITLITESKTVVCISSASRFQDYRAQII